MKIYTKIFRFQIVFQVSPDTVLDPSLDIPM